MGNARALDTATNEKLAIAVSLNSKFATIVAFGKPAC